MSPYHLIHQQALNRSKRGFQATPSAEVYMSESAEVEWCHSWQHKAPKYLFLCGSLDWNGGWDNIVKLTEGC